MFRKIRCVAWCVWLGLGVFQSAGAEVTLPAIFSDHMVLQQNRPISVWGWAAPGERVTVVLDTQLMVTDADGNGAWADNPVCNLYNGSDLPASPFRTDNWPGITANKQ